MIVAVEQGEFITCILCSGSTTSTATGRRARRSTAAHLVRFETRLFEDYDEMGLSSPFSCRFGDFRSLWNERGVQPDSLG